MQNSSFIFDSFDIDLAGKKITFNYVIQKDEEIITLTEKLILPREIKREVSMQLLRTIVSQLHLILGISYWKLYCSEKIILKSTQLNEQQVQFWNTLYTKGLGEFYYRNSIDYRNLVSFPATHTNMLPVNAHNVNRSLVGIGGGKDSIVSVELLKRANKQFSGYSILKQDSSIIQDTVRIGEIESLVVERIMDPQLADLNARKDTYNGHVPVSAIYAFVGVLLAALYDFSNVIASNEQSANYGNIDYLGMVVNHQWSKSQEFEELFSSYIHDFITPDINYFSLLRPWSEIEIAHIFSQYPQYFQHFSSCNRNFSSTRMNAAGTRWCGECPKCAFVFALLAAFIDKSKLQEIFGANLFDKASLLPLYKELLGKEGFKPFECVGTPEETQVAFYMAGQKGVYDDDIVMKMFKTDVLPSLINLDKIKEKVFEHGDAPLIPEQYKSVLNI